MKADRFWNRIEMYFIQGKTADCPARTRSSLNHRWGVIQHAVNKFRGLLSQIQEARRMYLAVVKNPLHFDRRWALLKDQEKWKKHDQFSGIKRKLKLSGPSNQSTPETINLGEDCEEPNEENINKRPGGRKAAKELLKL
ncbi:hypothetical protein OROMI_009797 [Orobanche minor]